jgi:hypothetical protein
MGLVAGRSIVSWGIMEGMSRIVGGISVGLGDSMGRTFRGMVWVKGVVWVGVEVCGMVAWEIAVEVTISV